MNWQSILVVLIVILMVAAAIEIHHRNGNRCCDSGGEVGKHLEDYIQQLCTDSTYGNLSFFLYGRAGKQVEVKIIDHDKNMIEVDGFPIKLLITERNPRNINWKAEGVRVVVDCTGIG